MTKLHSKSYYYLYLLSTLSLLRETCKRTKWSPQKQIRQLTNDLILTLEMNLVFPSTHVLFSIYFFFLVLNNWHNSLTIPSLSSRTAKSPLVGESRGTAARMRPVKFRGLMSMLIILLRPTENVLAKVKGENLMRFMRSRFARQG